MQNEEWGTWITELKRLFLTMVDLEMNKLRRRRLTNPAGKKPIGKTLFPSVPFENQSITTRGLMKLIIDWRFLNHS